MGGDHVDHLTQCFLCTRISRVYIFISARGAAINYARDSPGDRIVRPSCRAAAQDTHVALVSRVKCARVRYTFRVSWRVTARMTGHRTLRYKYGTVEPVSGSHHRHPAPGTNLARHCFCTEKYEFSISINIMSASARQPGDTCDRNGCHTARAGTA